MQDGERHQELVRLAGFDGEEKGKTQDQPQFTEAQSKVLLAELSPKLKEELCQVLRAQQNNVPFEEKSIFTELAAKYPEGLTNEWA